MTPRPLLHLEGAAVFIRCVLAYHWTHCGWIMFAVLFLATDLSMAAYLANPRAGAITYNAIHTYIGPLALAGYSIGADRPVSLEISLIWFAHIGLDRMLGFGLKYPSHFKDTHLNPARHTLAL